MSRKVGQHHGDLRRALIDAALALVAEEASVEAISLRAIARRAGVTPGACYHHFCDRDALYATIAREGFEALADAQRAVEAPQPHARLAAMCAAYVRFALAHPTHYRLMFRASPSELQGDGAQLLGEVAMSTFTTLAGAVGAARPGSDEETRRRAILAWATAHGAVEVARWAAALDPGFDPEALARSVGEAVVAGVCAAS